MNSFTNTRYSRGLAKPAIGIILALLSMTAAAGKDPVYTGFLSDTALKGYDAVSYFTAAEPLKGDKSFSVEWRGASWLFASAANRDMFEAAPEKYAPQYGGYCAWAVSQGYTASGDPTVWAIVDGKLYVNYNDDVGRKWRKDPQRFIALANEQWPNVLE